MREYEMKFCRKCHTIQEDVNTFCPDCGTRLADAHKKGEHEEAREIREQFAKQPVVKIKGRKPELEQKEKFQYKQKYEMPSVSLPKVDLGKIRERFSGPDAKKIKIAGGLAVAIVAGYFIYTSILGSSFQFSFSALFSGINASSFLSGLSGGEVKDNSTAAATNATAAVPAKKCQNVTEEEEVKTPYTYTYKYAVVNSGQIAGTKTANINVENLESDDGVFKVFAEFKIGGARINESKSDTITASSKKIFEITYTGSEEDVILNNRYVEPPIKTMYNTTMQTKTVEKCG